MVAELYVRLYTYIQMTRKKESPTGRKSIRRKSIRHRTVRHKASRRESINLMASAETTKSPYASIEEVLGLYKPRKKAVTLRLDADVLAWFKKPGRGYQTRINKALRKVMRAERKEAGES